MSQKSTGVRSHAAKPVVKPLNPAASTLSALANSSVAASQSSATVAAYALDEKMFRAAGDAMPASPAQIVEFLAAFAGKFAVATLKRGLISPFRDPVAALSVTLIKNAIGRTPVPHLCGKVRLKDDTQEA